MTLSIDVKRTKSKVSDDSNLKVSMTLVEINKFAEFIREEEREACARIVEADADARGKGGGGLVLLKAAERIRARGEK